MKINIYDLDSGRLLERNLEFKNIEQIKNHIENKYNGEASFVEILATRQTGVDYGIRCCS